MYSLATYLKELSGFTEKETNSSDLYCVEADAQVLVRKLNIPSTGEYYCFSLVISGSATICYNEQTLLLHGNDFFTYSPGCSLKILSVTEDCRFISLFSNEAMTFESPIIRKMIRAAYFPIVELSKPKLTLSEEHTQHLYSLMKAIEIYHHSDHLFRHESLQMLYGLFLLNVMNIQEKSNAQTLLSSRAEELFIRFIRILPRYFMEHHDITFYADKLCITTTYLSRIVKQVTGRTVVEYINQMLLMEAVWLLKFTDDSIGKISETLHFAEQGNFTKFFLRHKGMTPKEYRQQN